MTDKITLSSVADLTQSTTAATTINNNFSTIETAMNNTLSRDGTQPNTMSNNLDMNSFQIVNLPAAATSSSPLRLQDLNTFIGGGTVTNIPSGGNTGDALVKNSGVNYDVKWTSDSNTVAAGTNITVTGTSPATVSTVASPTFGSTLINTTANSAFTVGPNGFTNPSFQVNAAATSGATGIAIINAAAGSGVTLNATSSGTNEQIAIVPKGNAPIVLTAIGSGTQVNIGNSGISGGILNIAAQVAGTMNIQIPGTGANGFLNLPNSADTLVGRATTDTLTNKSLTGPILTPTTPIAAGAIGFGSSQMTIGDGSASHFVTTLDQTQTLTNKTLTSPVINGGTSDTHVIGGATPAAGTFTTLGSTSTVGFVSGAGGTISQATNRTTGVTLNKSSGAITMVSAAGSATAATFTVTNNTVTATDTIILNQRSGTNLYNFIVTAVTSGTFNITFFTTGGTATDAPVINFNVIKGINT